MTETKPKVEAIFPLTVMQQAFLFHHLQNENDQGFLHVQLTLVGKIDLHHLEKAWQQIVQRHEVLRTSVHWQKIEKPVQVVHKSANMPIEVVDWSNRNKEQFEAGLIDLKNIQTLKLSKAPVAQISLIKKSETKHILLWACHHLLLDGWSAANIIKDVFSCYDAFVHNKAFQVPTLPSYKVYYNWLQQQQEEDAKQFWKKAIEQTNTPLLFKEMTRQAGSFREQHFSLSEERTEQLKNYARQHRLTASTIIKGLWGILLSQFFKEEVVTFGATVSGRSAPIPNIDLMAGLFMNVLPTQVKISQENTFLEWIQAIQSQQAEAINYESNTSNQILNWIDAKQATLFDSLIVFENFPWANLKSGHLEVQDFKGGLTTIYPLTLIIKPFMPYEFTLRYDERKITSDFTHWCAKQIVLLTDTFLEQPSISLDTLLKSIETSPQLDKNQAIASTPTNHANFAFKAPQNALELKLTKLWENVLGFSPISAESNFFEIGGKSLHAVRFLSQLESQLGFKLPPSALLEHPSIRQLAKRLSDKEEALNWSNLFPLRAKGNKPPLFCIHGGGGHVFFYRDLANHLDKEQPVYSIQPQGLEGNTPLHQSIEEMAKDYLKDIKAIQPEGPYLLLTYCFSVPVGIEISKLLQAEGQVAPMVIVIDSSPPVPSLHSPDLSIKQRIERIPTLTREEIKQAIFNKLTYPIRPLINRQKKKSETNQERVLREIQENLYNIYTVYELEPFRGKITFIRSSEFTNAIDLHDHDKEWEGFPLDGMDTFVVDGHHYTLFEEPEVQSLAQQTQVCIDIFCNQVIE